MKTKTTNCSCCGEIAKCEVSTRMDDRNALYYTCDKCERYFGILRKKEEALKEKKIKKFITMRDKILKNN